MNSPFPPDMSQIDMLVQLLDAFPGNGVTGVGAHQVLIQPKARQPWAEQLLRRGVRIHPELMEEMPLPKAPGTPWLAPTKWVPAAEFEAQAAPLPPAEQFAEFRNLLRRLDPATADRIEGMTDTERAAAMGAMVDTLKAATARADEIRAQNQEAE